MKADNHPIKVWCSAAAIIRDRLGERTQQGEPMTTKDDSHHFHPLGWRVILGGIVVTVVGGLILYWITSLLPFFPAPPPTVEKIHVMNALPIGSDLWGNARSAQSKYGCTILLGATDAEQLRVCNDSYNLPTEWITKVQRFVPDCTTTFSDRIIIELWTGENLTGEKWAYSSDC